MKKLISIALITALAALALAHYGAAFLASLAALAFMIFFHELGHFAAARACGVAVRRFSVGFGQVVAAKRYGRTIYQISAIPLGGYVKMKGQSDLPKKPASDGAANLAYSAHAAHTTTAQPRIARAASYEEISLIKKLIILLAGPGANLLLGWLIVFGVAFAPVQDLAPRVGASDNAALQIGDEILSINGVNVRGFSEISEQVKERNLLQIRRGEQLLNLSVQARQIAEPDALGELQTRWIMGIKASAQAEVITYQRNFAQALHEANAQTAEFSSLILRSLAQLITGRQSLENIGGIIAINDVTSTAAQQSFVRFAIICALISINLGIMNLLPIPVLDGGHILLHCLGAIFGARAQAKMQQFGGYLGIALLGALMCLATYNDFMHYIFQEKL